MAGLDANTPTPTRIVVHKVSRQLEVEFSDGKLFKLSFEMLRVYSPSAEVRGHGPGQEVLQVGKQDVDLTTLEPVGNYAVQPTFGDGHNSGIYSWDYLHWLGLNQDDLWKDYLKRLRDAGASRESAAVPGKANMGAAVEFKAVSRPK
jgi:DUF971 family protein